MILSHETTTTVLLLWSYVFIYNLALFVLFTTIFQLSLTNFKTLYSFTHFKGTHVSTKLLIVSLLSMAGIPPFVGFFSKLFILILLLNSNFVLLSFFFFHLATYEFIFLYPKHPVFKCFILVSLTFSGNFKPEGSS